MKRRLVIIALCVSLLLPGTALAAVFNLPRDYIPAPPGTFAILTYYQHISAQNAYANGHQVTNDLGLTGNVGLFRPVYWLEAGPFIIDPQFIIPFGNLSLNTGSGLNSVNTSTTGFGDPLWFATFWFIHNDKTKTYVGFTPIFITPLGTYDQNKTLNLGANRWSFDEQLGIVQGVEVIPGHNAYFEIQAHGQFYTDNYNFLNPGVVANRRFGTLSQNPEFDLESHLSYDITKTVFASVDYYGAFFGTQSFQGVSLNNSLATNTIGGTLAYSFAPGYQLLLQYKGDVSTKNGPQENLITVRFLWATDLHSLIGKLTK